MSLLSTFSLKLFAAPISRQVFPPCPGAGSLQYEYVAPGVCKNWRRQFAQRFAAHTVLGLYLRCIDLRISTETHYAHKRAEVVQIYLLRQYSLSSAVSSSHSRQHPT